MILCQLIHSIEGMARVIQLNWQMWFGRYLLAVVVEGSHWCAYKTHTLSHHIMHMHIQVHNCV